MLFVLVLASSACKKDTLASADTDTDTATAEFDISTVGVIINGERISVQKNLTDDGYTLYLPAYAEDAIWSFESQTDINGNKISNGDSAEMLLDAESVTIGNCTVKIMRSANIPTLFLSSDDGSMEKINSSPDHSYGTGGDYSLISPNGEILAAGRLKKLRGRGNATWYGPEKKPYQIELSSAKELLGLAKAKKYILLANYYDPSLLRNKLAFELAKAYDGYTVSGEPVDLYACGEYLGSYLLCEKIDIAENKLSITDLEKATEALLPEKPESYERGGDISSSESGSSKWFELPAEPKDITGGYLLEVDYPERYPNEVSGFVSNRGLPIVIISPECASRAQVEYIKEFVCDFEDALYSEDGYNEKGLHYSHYADVDSLVFRYLFEEFVLNIDGGISSLHIYKDTEENGGKLNFSCVWDYDCSLGNYNKYADLTSPETLFTASSETRNNGTVPSWFNAMLRHDELAEKTCDYYANVFRPSAISISKSVDALYELIAASAEMDAKLYSALDHRSFYCAESGNTPKEAAEYLKSFISKRIDFFDIHFEYSIE